ncbi:MAG: hypothetical protein L0211_04650 [Planctomycetaceae bacterium]|nr:hypothetical protein [Planctomycetaceae bacterium]
MKPSRRVLVWVGIGVLFLITGGLALYYANAWWLSTVMSVSIAAWLAGVLAAIYSRPERRGVVIGAVLASFLYVLFALGPWFRVNVGPWLLTSQALAHVETKWLGRATADQQLLALANVVSPNTLTLDSSGTVLVNVTGSITGTVNVPTVAHHSSFVVIGHWLCGWLSAALGALAASWMTRRQAARTRPADAEDKP